MKKIIIYLITLLNGMGLLAQNSTTISGFVYDKATGEVLIGATIYEHTTKSGVITNEYGFYSITTSSKDSLLLKISFSGYKPLQVKIPKGINKQMDFKLIPGIDLEEITIIAKKEKTIVERNEVGVVRLPMKDIKTLPNLFGEVDIIKAYQLTPGVQSGGEAKSNLYVRGGSPDQNLILLDDVPLYYVAHFGGFFSVFNADAINDVKLVKGGFPARYGSRLSSVLDIRMKEGSMQQLQVQGTAGLLSSKLSIEAPIIKDKLSFIFSGRKNILPIFKLIGTGLGYHFYDLNAKLNYRISPKDKLFLSFYMGDDILLTSQKSTVTKHKTSVKWGNTLFAFRWNHIYNNRLFSNLTFSNTYYRYKNTFKYDLETDDVSKNVYNSVLTKINDLSLKLDFLYTLNALIDFKFGVNTIRHTFTPNDEEYSLSFTNTPDIHEQYSSISYAIENAVYLENNLNFGKININAGARYSSYYIDDVNYHSFEPRIVLNYKLMKNIALKYSFSKMNQYVHLLAYSGVGVPSDYWMPTNKNIKPENSTQHTFGIANTFWDNRYELSIEAYHKTLSHLITFIPGKSFLGNLDSWENLVQPNGKGTNYGVELFLQKKTGKTTGWVGATLSKAERKFEHINQGKPYAFKYDRLLDISIVVNHHLKKNVSLSATWTYGTGYPMTIATEVYHINNDDILVYEGKNTFKMRDYHRLDISANFSKKNHWGERTISISIFNLYNRKNPYFYYYDRISDGIAVSNGGHVFSAARGDLKLYQKSLFSIFPSISYSFKF